MAGSKGVPADVGHFLTPGGEALAAAEEVPKPALAGGFGAAFEQPLHAHADAQKRHAAPDGFANRRGKAGLVQAGGGGEMADPRQHDALGFADNGRVLGRDRAGGHGRHGLHHAGEVAGLVVDDRDHSFFLIKAPWWRAASPPVACRASRPRAAPARTP